MSRIQQGTAGLIYQGRSFTYSPSGGIRNTEIYQGESDAVETAWAGYVSSGIACSKESLGNGKAKLLVEYSDPAGAVGGAGTDDYVHTLWSLHPSLERRSLVKHPYIKSVIDGLDVPTSITFANAVKYARSGSNPFTDLVQMGLEPVNFELFTGPRTGLNWVIYEYLKGDETYDHIWATLKKNRTCPRNTAIASDWTQLMYVYTTDQLTTEQPSIPSAIIGTLPSGDWLKLPGQVDQMQDGRVVISTEWHYRDTGGWDEQVMSGGNWQKGTHQRVP